MAVSGKISVGSFKLHKTCQSGVFTNNIIILYNFQAYCIAGYR